MFELVDKTYQTEQFLDYTYMSSQNIKDKKISKGKKFKALKIWMKSIRVNFIPFSFSKSREIGQQTFQHVFIYISFINSRQIPALYHQRVLGKIPGPSEKPLNRPISKLVVTYQTSGSTFSILDQYRPTLKISGKLFHALRRNRLRKKLMIIIIWKQKQTDSNKVSLEEGRPHLVDLVACNK